MTKVGSKERETQKRVINLFQQELGYRYLGNLHDQENKNIKEDLLKDHLLAQNYSLAQINQAIKKLQDTANHIDQDLYLTNKQVYQLLRYGADIKVDASSHYEKVNFINWHNFADNDFAIAEEVSVKGENNKRPDLVIYINGIAIGVIELKRSSVSIQKGVRQNITNQQNNFIKPFFTTVQYLFSGNDTEGLLYGTINTPAEYYLSWKEDIEDNSRLLLDKYLLKMCNKERFLDLLYNFVLFDAGIKKLPRVHQYFGIKAAQKYVNRYEGGIIWHTQGSGKSLVMVWLAKWILENKPKSRIVILTDRDELDKQIEMVFKDAEEKDIYRTSSGKDLMTQLGKPSPRLVCSLIHKFGKKDGSDSEKFIQELKVNPINTVGEIFVFVDECHRTQSGKLHKAMKAILPEAVFIGFTGTPLLKKDKSTTQQVFGKYIHTYKYNEAVEDKVVLDLDYEYRDIDQMLGSAERIDEYFKRTTKGLTEFQQMKLKKKWATMQKVLSTQPRIKKIAEDIAWDFMTKPRLSDEKGNAILVASSIYDACRYYKAFEDTQLANKYAIVTSYNPSASDISTEDIGAHSKTEKQFMFDLYEKLLDGRTTEQYEDWAKNKFKNEPANMKLLIVVSKLLTGFDAPSCSYLYIDKSMQDHGLFQAITRTNRLDSVDKTVGHIVDYKDLFKKLVNDKGTGALQVYTSELDTENADKENIEISLQDRLTKGKERLEQLLENLSLLCEPVERPKALSDYIRYFCGNTEIPEELKEREVLRVNLYQEVASLVRAYANIANELEEAGYSKLESEKIKNEVNYYVQLREDIRFASGEYLDVKNYEADMRRLLDQFIRAEDPSIISPFEDMSLLDIVESDGIKKAIESLPKNIQGSHENVAETIENNVRQKIMREHLIDPAFFGKMSEVLEEIIKTRKQKAINYQEYLKKIAELAKQVNAGKDEETPEELKTPGQRALYNYLDQNLELALKVDQSIHLFKRSDWRGNIAKERVIKGGIYQVLLNYAEDEVEALNEPKTSYSDNEIVDKVEEIFEIVKAQIEY